MLFDFFGMTTIGNHALLIKKMKNILSVGNEKNIISNHNHKTR